MRGIDNLIKMRLKGKRPDHVWINFDHEYRPPKYDSEWHGMELEYKPTRDLRPFKDMDILIHSRTWNKDVAELYEALQAYANLIYVFIDDFGDDLGWKWDKQRGRHDYA